MRLGWLQAQQPSGGLGSKAVIFRAACVALVPLSSVSELLLVLCFHNLQIPSSRELSTLNKAVIEQDGTRD